jgi:hypothetical protein
MQRKKNEMKQRRPVRLNTEADKGLGDNSRKLKIKN